LGQSKTGNFDQKTQNALCEECAADHHSLSLTEVTLSLHNPASVHTERNNELKTITPLWQIASILMIALIAGLALMAAISGLKPVLLGALLIAFMSQMSCFTFVGLSDRDQFSVSLSDRRRLIGMLGGTAVSVMLVLSIMLLKLISVTL
jgi:hypothetical protein